MRFIADENIPNALILAIRRKSYSIKDIKEENLIGISDQELLAIAKKEQRIIITFDKDFTNLLQFPLKSHSGIMVLRYSNKYVQNVVTKFCYLLDSPFKDRFENSLCEIFDNYLKINHENENKD